MIFSNLLSIRCYRTFQQSFLLQVNSDIFLPLIFDNDKYDFAWNIEAHNLNYERLPLTLKKLNETLNWENDELLIKEYHERGALQIGYNLFINPETITRHVQHKNNEQFDLETYLNKINNSI